MLCGEDVSLRISQIVMFSAHMIVSLFKISCYLIGFLHEVILVSVACHQILSTGSSNWRGIKYLEARRNGYKSFKRCYPGQSWDRYNHSTPGLSLGAATCSFEIRMFRRVKRLKMSEGRYWRKRCLWDLYSWRWTIPLNTVPSSQVISPESAHLL